MSAFELVAVIAGAVIAVLVIWSVVRRHALGGTFHQKVEISFDKDIPDDGHVASNDPEISFDKSIPDDRP